MSNDYKPQPKADLLRTFVEMWFGPQGRAGDGSTWRCGFMSGLLSKLLTASDVPHRVLEGAVNIGGVDIPHIWIGLVQEGSGELLTLDPSEKQFGKGERNYFIRTVHKPADFNPLAYKKDQADNIPQNEQEPVRPQIGQIWEHRKGARYFVADILNPDNPLDDDNNSPVIVYIDGAGKRWARLERDWYKSFTMVGKLKYSGK